MNADNPIQALLARGRLLREHGRAAEAEQLLGNALQIDPNNAWVFCEIAFCRLAAGAREQTAIDAIDRAIALDPEIAYFHAIRALILHDLERHADALASADQAISLDPEEETAHVARAHALMGVTRWADAETSVRRALEIDPDYSAAHNLLSTLLRIQNRPAENAEQIRFLLERNPDDDRTHVNAGWAALRGGDRLAAQRHFLEALRLNPESEQARHGLLESYKSRSWVYRQYLNFVARMTRFSRRQRWAVIIGIYIAYQFIRRIAAAIGTAWAAAIVAAYLLFVLWSHLARSVGNLLVLIDRTARHALKFQERLDGGVGAMILGGIGIGAAGAFTRNVLVGALGAWLLTLSVPLSKALLNNSRVGRFLFGGIALYVFFAGLVLFAAEWLPALTSLAIILGVSALVAAGLSTILGNFRTFDR